MGPLRLNQDLLGGGKTDTVTKVDSAIRIARHSVAKPQGRCIGKQRKLFDICWIAGVCIRISFQKRHITSCPMYCLDLSRQIMGSDETVEQQEHGSFKTGLLCCLSVVQLSSIHSSPGGRDRRGWAC